MEKTNCIPGKPYIVKQLAISATLRNVPRYATVRFKRIDLQVSERTLDVLINRLNRNIGRAEFSYAVDPTNADYLITRK